MLDLAEIAPILLKEPPIQILDETTSAVENETEAAIQKSLDYITANRMTVAIAHQLSASAMPIVSIPRQGIIKISR